MHVETDGCSQAWISTEPSAEWLSRGWKTTIPDRDGSPRERYATVRHGVRTPGRGHLLSPGHHRRLRYTGLIGLESLAKRLAAQRSSDRQSEPTERCWDPSRRHSAPGIRSCDESCSWKPSIRPGRTKRIRRAGAVDRRKVGRGDLSDRDLRKPADGDALQAQYSSGEGNGVQTDFESPAALPCA